MGALANDTALKIAEALKAGRSNGQVAAEFGVSIGTVAGVRRRHNVKTEKSRDWPVDDVRVLCKLLKWNWPIPSIAQALGVSAAAVRCKMSRLGLSYRTPSTPRTAALMAGRGK